MTLSFNTCLWWNVVKLQKKLSKTTYICLVLLSDLIIYTAVKDICINIQVELVQMIISEQNITSIPYISFISFFSIRLLSVLRGDSVFPSLPQLPMTSDFEGFSIPDCIHYIHFPILILEKEPVFSLLNVECYIFIRSLVCRGPWLGIEPGTSRTWSQRYTTRLSRRR